MEVRVLDCTGHLEGLQHALYLYGYIEAVVLGVMMLYMILIETCEMSCVDWSNQGSDSCVVSWCRWMFCSILTPFFGFNVLVIIFDVVLITGLYHHNSTLVLSVGVVGVLSNLVRIAASIYLIIKFYKFCNEPYDKNRPLGYEKLILGYSICSLVYSVLYCVILWMVFQCYEQIKSDPHCLHH